MKLFYSKFRIYLFILGIFVSVFMPIQNMIAEAAAPDCTRTNFGRCLNVGYFTGSTDTDDATLPVLYPIEPSYTYSESCHALPIPITSWSFPQVICNSSNNSGYTTQFINQIKSYLDNFCDAELSPLSVTTTCGLQRRNGIAAAQIVNTMLGVDGTTYGSNQFGLLCPGGTQWYLDCYEKSFIKGVDDARTNFGQWSYLVTRYDQLGRVNWNGIEAYTPGDINSGGINYGTDVDFHAMKTHGWTGSITLKPFTNTFTNYINANNMIQILKPCLQYRNIKNRTNSNTFTYIEISNFIFTHTLFTLLHELIYHNGILYLQNLDTLLNELTKSTSTERERFALGFVELLAFNNPLYNSAVKSLFNEDEIAQITRILTSRKASIGDLEPFPNESNTKLINFVIEILNTLKKQQTSQTQHQTLLNKLTIIKMGHDVNEEW